MSRAKTASKKRRVAAKPIARQHLLSLPAEIRNRIWEYVIGGKEPPKHKIGPPTRKFVDISSPAFKNHIRFIYTCRQIYNEASLMFYHRQALSFPLNNTPESHLKLLRFASKISPRSHRFVGSETCWNLDHARQLTDEERSSVLTLFLQMASLGWTRRLFFQRRLDTLPKGFVEIMAADHQLWGEDAYENAIKRYLFRMLLRHVRTEYLRRPAVVALWVFIVKPSCRNLRQLLEIWTPWYDPVNDPICWAAGLLLRYLQFRLNIPLAPKEWDFKAQWMFTVIGQVVGKILWNMRHWFARQALVWFNLIKNVPGALHAYAVAKRRKCTRIYKQLKNSWEEKRKREAIHGLDASSTAIFALWPLLLCLVLCVGTIVYEYTGPVASLLSSSGATVIGKAVALIALLRGYARQAIA